jgi:hypothetical protein
VRTVEPVPTQVLARLPAALSVGSEDGSGYVIETSNAPALLVQLTAALHEANVLASEIRVGDRSLEDLFLRLTAREER